MMRRVFAAALALFLAVPANAGRVAVIPPSATYGSSGNADASSRQQVGKWLELLDVMGVQYDVLPQSACPTTQISNGTISFPYGDRAYSAFIHIGWKVGGTNASGYNPDSLWRAGDAVTTRARWSSVPQIFCGPTTTSSVSFAGTAACTTAMNALPVPFSSADAGIATHEFLTNGPEIWHDYSTSSTTQPVLSTNVIYPALPRDNAITSGITRTIVGVKRTNAGYGIWDGLPPIDGITRPTQATADTFILSARYRGPKDVSPIIFVYPNAGNGPNPQVSLMAMALAVADSVSGRQIIGQKPGWTPKKIAVYVSRAFTRGGYSAVGSSHEARGWFCVTDSCDTTFYKGSIDSLASLNIPYTIGVNIDSVSAYPYEKAWWNRLPKRNFTVESWNAVSKPAATDTAGLTWQPDIFGKVRTRTLLPVTGRTIGQACPAGDTSLTCLLTYARRKLIINGLTPLSKAVIGPESDYLPVNFTAKNMPTWDSLGVALLAAGYSHIITNPDAVSAAPVQFSVNGAGTSQPSVTDPGVLDGFRERTIPIYANRYNSGQTRIGTIKNVCARGFVDDPQAANPLISPMLDLQSITHPYANEFLQGVFGNIWYAGDMRYYFHSFRTPTSVYILRAGGLGMWSGKLDVNATRYEWYYLKWMYNQISAINRLAGRSVVTFVGVDEL
jgi:hypothetical protein